MMIMYYSYNLFVPLNYIMLIYQPMWAILLFCYRKYSDNNAGGVTDGHMMT